MYSCHSSFWELKAGGSEASLDCMKLCLKKKIRKEKKKKSLGVVQREVNFSESTEASQRYTVRLWLKMNE